MFSKNSDLIIDGREITEKKPTNAEKSAFETLKFKRNQENRFGKMKHKLTFQSIFTSFLLLLPSKCLNLRLVYVVNCSLKYTAP